MDSHMKHTKRLFANILCDYKHDALIVYASLPSVIILSIDIVRTRQVRPWRDARCMN